MPPSLQIHPILLSVQVAGAATFIAITTGTLLGYILAKPRWRGYHLLDTLILLPLVLPPTVLGYYLLVLISRRGPVGIFWESFTGGPLVFTAKAAVLAACVSTIPLVARIAKAAFASVPREAAEAARLDGAGFWRLFWDIELPQSRASIAAAGALAFARAIGDFGTTLMVAGNIPGETRTASIAIYDLMNAGHDHQALILVLLISFISLGILVVAGMRYPSIS
jgi:molybdate transport system permease protein